jgi:HSP20 family protein
MTRTTTLQRRALGSPFMSNIAREVDHLQDSIRRMFDNPFTVATEPLPFAQPIGWFPAVEITESDNELTMTAELPGLDRKDVKIDLDGNLLTLSGEKREEKIEEGTDKEYHIEERMYGAFQRSFTLPLTVESDKITAEFDKGILTVRLPKSRTVTPRGREIPINEKK